MIRDRVIDTKFVDQDVMSTIAHRTLADLLARNIIDIAYHEGRCKGLQYIEAIN